MAKSKIYKNLRTRLKEQNSIQPSNLIAIGLSQELNTQSFEPRRGDRRTNKRSLEQNLIAKIEQRSAPIQPQKKAGIVYIKERFFTMLKKDLILSNPLRMMGFENEDILSTGNLGAVLARAGVGKTAFLVQLSLNALLRGKNVLHISLEDPVNKVSLWYKEVFSLIANQYKVDQINQLWDSLLPHRFIMTFRVEGFSVPKLQERLADLMEQNIFSPQMIIVDGLPFDKDVRAPLAEFKKLVEHYGIHAWFTARTHRHEKPGPDGIPMQLVPVSDLFEITIQLLPVGKEIHVKAFKENKSFSEHLDLRLDPSTMLIKSN